ncbi:MAG: AmmeMemoRadiSam system protein B [Desulfohalobiaceae bacterium]|nr:AmmeMemoRadiSam system protein B [Desulfohalobiaceae bacterium]
MIRKPAVAGRFYPGSKKEWQAEVRQHLAEGQGPSKTPILSMLPHAGYVFSGRVAGRTLADTVLSDTVLLLGPNHTGLGAALAVWAEGSWEIPGAMMKIDEDLAGALLEAHPDLSRDTAAHTQEHSLEVILPFLWVKNPKAKIVPVCVAAFDPVLLTAVGKKMGRVLRARSEPVSIIVSSDMSHFVSDREARLKDEKAIQAILEIDPMKLHRTVQQEGISMCGVLPMTLGLSLALELGASRAELVEYANSGDVTGDRQQVVAYAGIRVF